MLTSTLLRSPIRALRFVGVYRLVHSSSGRPTLTYCTSYHANTLLAEHRTRCDLFSMPHHVTSHVTVPVRCYAKKTKEKKGKSGKKGDKPKVTLSETEIGELIDVQKMNEQMSATVETLQRDLMEKFSLRTNSASLENLKIETPDGTFPLIQIAQVIQKSPNMIIINLGTTAHYSNYVRQALMKSEMNLNPQQDGTSFFVPIPRVTREHRENLAKNTKPLNEKTKEKLKSIQNKYIKDAKKQKDEVSSDLLHHVQEHILHITKTFAEQADALVEAKKQELLGS